VTSNVKGQMERKFSKANPKISKILTFSGPWRSVGKKSCDFNCKTHVFAWIHVVRAILRKNRLGVSPLGLWGKNSESHSRLP